MAFIFKIRVSFNFYSFEKSISMKCDALRMFTNYSRYHFGKENLFAASYYSQHNERFRKETFRFSCAYGESKYAIAAVARSWRYSSTRASTDDDECRYFFIVSTEFLFSSLLCTEFISHFSSFFFLPF